MKEQYQTIKKSEIKWPKLGKVEVSPDVDFVYIMRKDGNFAMSSVSTKMATDYNLNEEEVKSVLFLEYDIFFAKLADILKWGFSSKGNFELHIFDPSDLDKGIRQKSQGYPIVSLDPLMINGVEQHAVSRGFYLGGKKDFGQVSRPGNYPLSTQAEKIADKLGKKPVVVSEDDIFSGGSVIASLNELKNNGIPIQKLIPGIQVGELTKLSEMGIPLDTVVKYGATDDADIFDKVDLGDPRDYLLGASGLVIKLPNGQFGRAPYILPFVSTSARASIPKEIEKEFGIKVLEANLEFFSTVKNKIGKQLLLKHMDQHFVGLMNQLYGFDHNTPMEKVVMWAINNIDSIWKFVEKQGEFQQKLESMHLPKQIVFLDVNGTLFPDESTDGFIPPEDIEDFKKVVASLITQGISVGLCSDSPLPQLQKIEEQLDIKGPIIAENGNILFYNDQSIIINSLPGLEMYKQSISFFAANCGFQITSDIVAPEFGGNIVDYNKNYWSFGSNRQTSITVFGPEKLITDLGNSFKNQQQGISIDCSPEYNFFAIHPRENYKQNKGQTLALLSAYGYSVLMVGNSMSDWVDKKSNVTCVFVGASRISQEIKQKAAYISDKPVMKGVIDILSKVTL